MRGKKQGISFALLTAVLLGSELAMATQITPTSIQTVDTNGFGGISVAVNSQGEPSLSYLSSDNDGVKYATMSGSSWSTQFVDNVTTENECNTSLALTSSGSPCITYCDFSGSSLKFATWNGQKWMTQTVDSSPVTGLQGYLSLDSQGNPHILYRSNGNVNYAVWNGNSWNIQTVSPYSGNGMAMQLDANGNPHIVFPDWNDHELKYATYNGTSWTTTIVDTPEYEDFPSLALDTAGNPRISYSAYVNNIWVPEVAEFNGTSWSIYTLNADAGGSGGLGDFSSIAIDREGQTLVAFIDGTNTQVLGYAVQTGSAWTINQVGPETSVRYPSLALNQDTPVIGYDGFNGVELATLAPIPKRLLGDANDDGKVDSLDLAILLNDYGMPVTGGYDSADFNLDDVVNADDLALFQSGLAEYNQSIGNPLPEPATLSLFALGALVLVRRRKA